MDEGLNRCFFDRDIALWYGGSRTALITCLVKINSHMTYSPFTNTKLLSLCWQKKKVIVAEVMDFCLCEGRKKFCGEKKVFDHQSFLLSFSALFDASDEYSKKW